MTHPKCIACTCVRMHMGGYGHNNSHICVYTNIGVCMDGHTPTQKQKHTRTHIRYYKSHPHSIIRTSLIPLFTPHLKHHLHTYCWLGSAHHPRLVHHSSSPTSYSSSPVWWMEIFSFRVWRSWTKREWERKKRMGRWRKGRRVKKGVSNSRRGEGKKMMKK